MPHASATEALTAPGMDMKVDGACSDRALPATPTP